MFLIKCFGKENISKIVRPLLAAMSVNGLTGAGISMQAVLSLADLSIIIVYLMGYHMGSINQKRLVGLLMTL